MVWLFIRQGIANLFFAIKNFWRIRKLKLHRQSLSEQIKERFALIGKDVYRHRGELGAVQKKADAISREVADMEERLIAIEQEILHVKESQGPDLLIRQQLSFVPAGVEPQITCPACKALHVKEALYCGNCGIQLIDSEEPLEESFSDDEEQPIDLEII